ncbi:MAG: hypothetical protein IKU46_08305 [Peptococcaceae bacterium]|nr:hypothetical protein [Peptococcaceae bacterium]
MTEKEAAMKKEELPKTVAEAAEKPAEPVQDAVEKKEKTPEELALEAGYYASCFRSH